MSDDPENVRKHMRIYFAVFGSLLVLTVITVAVSYINLGVKGNIALALAIAALKASLVAGFFMHLVSEKFLIHKTLAFTVVFFLGLMLLTALSWNDMVAR